MAKVAFIGLGNMGGPMAANLVKAGHAVQGFDLVQASKDAAKADGVAIAASAADAVKGAEVVITMLPAGKHVVSVWQEVIPAAQKGTLIRRGRCWRRWARPSCMRARQARGRRPRSATT